MVWPLGVIRAKESKSWNRCGERARPNLRICVAAEGGSVINISALVSTTGFPGAVVYNATKGAVDTITLTLANELGPKKIRVNAINPGLVATETALAMISSDLEKGLAAQTPLGRIGQPEDYGPVAVFFASEDSKFVTGRTLIVSGGLR